VKINSNCFRNTHTIEAGEEMPGRKNAVMKTRP